MKDKEKVTLEMLQAKQKELVDGALAMTELAEKQEGEKIVERAKDLEKLGKELEALAKAFEAQAMEDDKPVVHGIVEVQLTAGQTARIEEETGVHMPFVGIQSDGPFMLQYMPTAAPEEIEALALKQAREAVLKEQAERESRENAQAVLKELEKQKNPDLQKMVEKLKEDPDFLGGLMND